MISINKLSLFDLILLNLSLQSTRKGLGEYEMRFKALEEKVNKGLDLYIQNKNPQELKEEFHGIVLIFGKDDPELRKLGQIIETVIQAKIDMDVWKNKNIKDE